MGRWEAPTRSITRSPTAGRSPWRRSGAWSDRRRSRGPGRRGSHVRGETARGSPTSPSFSAIRVQSSTSSRSGWRGGLLAIGAGTHAPPTATATANGYDGSSGCGSVPPHRRARSRPRVLRTGTPPPDSFRAGAPAPSQWRARHSAPKAHSTETAMTPNATSAMGTAAGRSRFARSWFCFSTAITAQPTRAHEDRAPAGQGEERPRGRRAPPRPRPRRRPLGPCSAVGWCRFSRWLSPCPALVWSIRRRCPACVASLGRVGSLAALNAEWPAP